MKKVKLTIAAAMMIIFAAACNNQTTNTANADTTIVNQESDGYNSSEAKVKPGKYVNLSSGKEVYIIADPTTGVAIDSISQEPVQFYYDPVTSDTLYQTGLRVNSMLIKEGEGKYRLDDTKIKIDGDEIKIKSDSGKLKMDGNDMKVKSPDGKTKVDDNEMKSKSPDGKTKVDDGEMKVKP